VWSPQIPPRSNTGTSISENLPYAVFCELAARDDLIFSRFKSAQPYREVLEHTGLKWGNQYQRILLERNFKVSKEFLTLHSKIGDPEIYSFTQFGSTSPSLLRYLKVASDLSILFPHWVDGNIIEVGIGYGGQLATMKELGHRGDYAGIDLDGPIQLAKKYLKVSRVNEIGTLLINSQDSLKEPLSGIFLSNYAYSELRRDIQEIYFDKYIKSCPQGYVTWNTLGEKELGGMTSSDFANKVGGRVIPEEPLTHPGNSIVVWGSQAIF
jgi:hypothetical protein